MQARPYRDASSVRALGGLGAKRGNLAVRARNPDLVAPAALRVVERLVGRAEQGLGFGGVIGKIATPSDAVTPMSWTPSSRIAEQIASALTRALWRVALEAPA